MNRLNLSTSGKFKAYIGLAIFLALFIISVVVAAYIFMWVVLVGAVIFVISLLKQKIFGPASARANHQADATFSDEQDHKIGHTYEHDSTDPKDKT